MDDDATPAQVGLRKIVAALSRQLNATRHQLLALQAQRQRKEGLLASGHQVLEEHCAASWAGGGAGGAAPPRATLTAAAPTPAGWRIGVAVEGLPPGAGVAVVVVHRGAAGGCVVRQTGRHGTAVIKPLSGGGAGGAQADVFAVVTSPVDRGAPVAALHAGRARLDAASWLRALAGSAVGGSEGLDDDAAAAWPHAARFLVTGANASAVQEALERELGCLEGGAVAAGTRSWAVGRAGEVRCRVEGGSLALEILGDTVELVWAVKGELEAALQSAAEAAGAAPPQWTAQTGSSPDGAPLDAVDALLAELDALAAWMGSLKDRAAGGGDGRAPPPAAAQAAAVEAMMRTDRAALSVSAPIDINTS